MCRCHTAFGIKGTSRSLPESRRSTLVEHPGRLRKAVECHRVQISTYVEPYLWWEHCGVSVVSYRIWLSPCVRWCYLKRFDNVRSAVSPKLQSRDVAVKVAIRNGSHAFEWGQLEKAILEAVDGLCDAATSVLRCCFMCDVTRRGIVLEQRRKRFWNQGVFCYTCRLLSGRLAGPSRS